MFKTKPFGPGDAERAAAIHDRAFRNFFLTSLGKKFLSGFYEALAGRNDTICRTYWDDENRMAGFFVANYSHQGFYKSLCATNLLPFISLSFLSFLRSPRLLLRLVNSFASNNHSHGFEAYPYLLSLCVDPGLQNKGLGKIMINELTTHLQKEGYSGLYLTTDSIGNNSVNSFYLRTGFEKMATFHQGKREMNVYFKDISAAKLPKI